MKSKRNIFITLILFTAVLFCFEANNHIHFNAHLINIENTSDSKTGEENCGSNSESNDDFKINSALYFSYLVGIKFDIPQSHALISTYIISFWQPPKIS
jgi:hypothetical protein